MPKEKLLKALAVWYAVIGLTMIASVSGCWQDHIDPPVVICKSADEAFFLSQTLAFKLNGRYESGVPKGWFTATDSGSMEPLIHFLDIIVTDNSIQLGKNQLGKPLVYNPDWKLIKEATVHRLVGWDGAGGIMEGDSEKSTTENKNRVNKSNYIGEVVKIYRVQK